jgi:hypothetical protein
MRAIARARRGWFRASIDAARPGTGASGRRRAGRYADRLIDRPPAPGAVFAIPIASHWTAAAA